MLIILKSYKTFAILRHVWIHITILWWMYIVHCTFNASNIWIDLYNGPPSKGDQDILHILHLSLNIPHHTPENIFLQSFCNRELKYTTFCALSICWNDTERIKTGRHCNALETIFFGTLLLGYQLLSPWTQNQIQIQNFDPQ